MPQRLSVEKRKNWRERIEQQASSGLSIEAWCRKHGIASHVFHYWKRVLNPQDTNFIELTEHFGCSITIEQSGTRILIHAPSVQEGLEILKDLRC